jgi:hypothetical protein
MTIMRGVVAACLLALASLASAQTTTSTRISGTLGGPTGGGDGVQGTFTCTGTPTCTGQYTVTSASARCTNTITQGDAFTMTGLELGRSGPLQGTMVFVNGDWSDEVVGGLCRIRPGTVRDFATSYTGTWNSGAGTGSLSVATPEGIAIPVTIKADVTTPPPVFAMTVRSSIDATSASTSANIQYRPQDVGTSGSVYVFAVAPANLVKSADDDSAPFTIGKTVAADDDKADPLACVLAQLNASGQLQAVSASSLQAYVTGVLSSQGQAVTILNGVSTPAVAGATFYVGYGASSSAMINNGINRSAVTVPGTRECRPQAPQTGWWWNPQQGGRGFSIEVQGNSLFMATYLYDASGRATWHVAAGPTSIDGSVFSNQLMSFANGVTLGGAYRPNSRLADAGAITLTFDDGEHGTLVWPGGTVALQRYAFGANGTATPPLANQPESGWWWGGTGDNGRGFFIEWQGNRAFLAGYMYDASGNAIWYVADAAVASARSFQAGWLQFANGQTLTGAYRAPTLVNGNVAPVTIQFQGADTALLTLPSGTLPLTRFRF